MSNPVIDLFVEEAKAVTVTDAALSLGLVKVTNRPHAGPCPSCGGQDRFAIKFTDDGAFNCRGCGARGRDGIALYALVNGHNLRTRSGFLAACGEALGRPVPDGGEVETERERQDRINRLAEQKRRNAERAEANAQSQNVFRQKEIDRARGLYLKAPEQDGGALHRYLKRRTGFDMHPLVFRNLRLMPSATYWHGKDERGFELDRATGPAMIAPFVNLAGQITGCHQTWINLHRPPKYRADFGCDEDGNPLPTKKMRGSKRGSLIPLFGLMASARWVGGEGIENGLTIAGSEGFRADTFYFAAGDLGNLAGPADPKSAFSHPHDTYMDKAGRIRAVRVQGPVPKHDQAPDEAMQVADHVTELILLADGDSEPVMTAAAMARAEARLSRPGRDVWDWRPRVAGMDFSGYMTGI
jgi:hypothetical protein